MFIFEIILGFILGVFVVAKDKQRKIALLEAQYNQKLLELGVSEGISVADNPFYTDRDIAKLKQEYEQKIKGLEKSYKQIVNDLNNKIQQLENSHQAEKQKLVADYENKIKQLKSENNSQLEKLINNQTTKLKELETTLNQAHLQEIQQLQQSHLEEIEKLTQAHQKELAKLSDISIASQPSYPVKPKFPPQKIPNDLNNLATIAKNLTGKDTNFRQAIADHIAAQISQTGSITQTDKLIDILATLAQDVDSNIRRSAIISLGKIKSEKVIPLLEKALQDSDPKVIQAASAALVNFKSYPRISKAKELPANAYYQEKTNKQKLKQ